MIAVLKYSEKVTCFQSEKKTCPTKNGNRALVKALSNFLYTHLVFENRHVDPRIKRLQGLGWGKFGLRASKKSLFTFFFLAGPSFFCANQGGSLIASCYSNRSIVTTILSLDYCYNVIEFSCKISIRY